MTFIPPKASHVSRRTRRKCICRRLLEGAREHRPTVAVTAIVFFIAGIFFGQVITLAR